MHIWVHEWQNACRFLFKGRAPIPSERPPVASERPPEVVTSEPAGPQRALLPQTPPADPPPVESAAASATPVRRNPQRNQQAPQRYWQHGYSVVKSYCQAMTGALLLT